MRPSCIIFRTPGIAGPCMTANIGGTIGTALLDSSFAIFPGVAAIEIWETARFRRFRGAHEDVKKPPRPQPISVRCSLGRRRAPNRENGETRG